MNVDVTLKNSPRWETGLQRANDVTHRKRSEGFRNLKKVSWDETYLGRRRLAFASSRGAARNGVGWKSQNRKIVTLSPYVEEPVNSKVIKSFVPEQRSRKCFLWFEIPIDYLYGHSMYVSLIAISWHGTEPTYYSSEPIQDVALKTYRERWAIDMGGGRGLGRSAQVARHDDDDGDDDTV